MVLELENKLAREIITGYEDYRFLTASTIRRRADRYRRTGGSPISSLTSSRNNSTIEGQLWNTGVMVTPHYFYETAVAYSDLGADQRLSPQGLLRLLQEAASVASDDVGFGLKDISRTGVQIGRAHV